jgi:hypothetical protein
MPSEFGSPARGTISPPPEASPATAASGDMKPRITVRGTQERFGSGQWNVLIENVEEVVRFWEENKIKTRIDWAGMAPPKATVGRRQLLAICDAAGEGAVVEYDLEVQDRANGRGTRGIGLRVIGTKEPIGGEPE